MLTICLIEGHTTPFSNLPFGAFLAGRDITLFGLPTVGGTALVEGAQLDSLVYGLQSPAVLMTYELIHTAVTLELDSGTPRMPYQPLAGPFFHG